MAKQELDVLKQFFLTGSRPTQQQFHDWLDSIVHKDDGLVINTVEEILAGYKITLSDDSVIRIPVRNYSGIGELEFVSKGLGADGFQNVSETKVEAGDLFKGWPTDSVYWNLAIYKGDVSGGGVANMENFTEYEATDYLPYTGATKPLVMPIETWVKSGWGGFGYTPEERFPARLSVKNPTLPVTTASVFGVYSSTGVRGLYSYEDSTGVLHANNRAGGSEKATNTTFGENANATPNAGLDNTAIGYAALSSYAGNSGGNTAVGQSAGGSLTSGNSNTFLGYQAGSGITTGTNNLVMTGHADTGDLKITTGRYNTLIGRVLGLEENTSSAIILADGSSNGNRVFEAKADDSLGVKLKGKYAVTAVNGVNPNDRGNITIPTGLIAADGNLVVKSPNGSLFKITVGNDGKITPTPYIP